MRRPGTAWHFIEIHEPPIGDVSWFQSEVIADGRRNIEPGAFVQVRFWPVVTENVLPVVGAEWSGVLPLRIRGSIAFADRDPSVFASRYGRSLVPFFKPRNNARRFGSMAFPRFIIVGEGAVEWIEPWREFYRNVIAATSRIRVVHSAIIFGPFLVPGAHPIGNGIVAGWFFADPENGGNDVGLPGVTLPGCGPIRGKLPRGERQ